MTRQTCWICVASAIVTGVVAVVTSQGLHHIDVTHQNEVEIVLRNIPVQVINEQHVETPKVRVGGRFAVEFNVSRTQSCKVTVHRYVVDKDSGVVVWSVITPGIVAEVGENQVGRWSSYLPPEIGPGRYEYRAFNYNECDRGRLFTQPAMPLEFEVIE